MNVIVFSGPTISETEGRTYLDAEFRPPAKQGDVYLACLTKPKAMVIIDGFFEQVPAIWHKEVLYAMTQGIHVYGCSSMGALRAVELELYGMEGFGQIYHDFKEGILEDDDEVTLVHAPREFHFQPFSDAMVNIRATLHTAQKEKILSSFETDTLIRQAKDLWYPNRSYTQLLKEAKSVLTKEVHQDLTDFVKSKSVDLKKQDAIGLLTYLSENVDFESLAPKKVDYIFPYTDGWEMLVTETEARSLREKLTVDLDQLLIELKLAGKYVQLKERALTRKSAIREAKMHNSSIAPELKQKALIELARRQNCIQEGQINFGKMMEWLNSQKMTMDDFHQLVEKQTSLEWLESIDVDLEQEMLELLKLDHDFGLYEKRLLAKQAAELKQITKQNEGKGINTKEIKIEEITLDQLGITENELWTWFFDSFLKRVVPEDVNAYAYFCGFNGIEELKEAVIKEYIYTKKDA